MEIRSDKSVMAKAAYALLDVFLYLHTRWRQRKSLVKDLGDYIDQLLFRLIPELGVAFVQRLFFEKALRANSRAGNVPA